MTADLPAEESGLVLARRAWSRLVPSAGTEPGPLAVHGENFSLTLDPDRYPVFRAADGGTLVVDTGKTLSPLVRTILQESDPRLKVVTAEPRDGKRFVATLLAAASFYSVEENPSLHFGTDPIVTVRTDFKIEKNQDSLLRNEVVLLNLSESRAGMPRVLQSFLGREGFQLVESGTPLSLATDGRKVLYSMTSGDQQSVVDELFTTLSLSLEHDRQVVIDDGAVTGVILSVRVDRYHERGGRKVVFSFAEGNPVQYTLLRLLELKGYRVVMVHPADEFMATVTTVLAAVGVSAQSGMQSLLASPQGSFDLRLSGVSFTTGERGATQAFVTDRALDPLVQGLASALGFLVVEK